MSENSAPKIKVLVVCLGNICRSPMGEAVLRHTANKRGISILVDSCGTAGYHVGEEPDERTIETCKKHEVPIDSIARKVVTSDFINFTHILAADESVLKYLEKRKSSTQAGAKISLWGSYLDGKPIPDPYYGKIEGFEEIFQQCVLLSEAFLDKVTKETEGL